MNGQITLDTPLSEIPWDDAQQIGDDLIDTDIAGDEWGLAWSRVLRAGGTVRDLRDDLYEHVLRYVHLTNFDDGEGDLVAGREVIGALFWDSTVGDRAGWVLRFGEEGLNAEDLFPSTTSEITTLLAERGYQLDTSSLTAVERFDPEAPR